MWLLIRGCIDSLSIFILVIVYILLEKKCLYTAHRMYPYSFMTGRFQERQVSGTERDLAAPLQVTLQKGNEPTSMK